MKRGRIFRHLVILNVSFFLMLLVFLFELAMAADVPDKMWQSCDNERSEMPVWITTGMGAFEPEAQDFWSDFFIRSEKAYLLDSSFLDASVFSVASLKPEREKVGYKDFFLDSLVIYAASWPIVLAIDSDTREGIIHSSPSKWIDNVSKDPNWNDGSSWVTNNVGHPFQGATYFLYYRCRGHNFLASSLGTILQTVLFEYTIQGFHNRPSLQDLVKTPGLGIPLGYAMDALSLYFLKQKKKNLRYLGYLFNPFNLLPWAKDRWSVAIDPLDRRLSFALKF